ncbi:MAG: hypothetical protein LC674_05210 [Actinobacteria bacterium]|nr:hypothetical protein [Actinomycetota bacterium]
MERFEEIYEVYRDTVEIYVRRRAPADLVDDVVADVFVVCLRRIHDVPAAPLPWLYAVARKTLANEAATRAHGSKRSVGRARSGATRRFGTRRRVRATRRKRSRNPAADRLGGTLPRRAATVLDCSRVTARVRYHRAKALAAHLAEKTTVHPIQQGATR